MVRVAGRVRSGRWFGGSRSRRPPSRVRPTPWWTPPRPSRGQKVATGATSVTFNPVATPSTSTSTEDHVNQLTNIKSPLAEPLDALLADIAIRVQLSETNYRKAVERYR